MKVPDGRGCFYCGASWASLEVVDVEAGELFRAVRGGELWERPIEVEDLEAQAARP